MQIYENLKDYWNICQDVWHNKKTRISYFTNVKIAAILYLIASSVTFKLVTYSKVDTYDEKQEISLVITK